MPVSAPCQLASTTPRQRDLPSRCTTNAHPSANTTPAHPLVPPPTPRPLCPRHASQSQLTRRHDLLHLLADRADLAGLCVARLADLVRPPLGEAQRKHAQLVAIRRRDIRAGLNERLPLADEPVQLVAREVHAIKRRQQRLALHLLAHQLDLAVVQVLRAVQVRQRHLKYAALERLAGDLWRRGVVCGRDGEELARAPSHTGRQPPRAPVRALM